MLTQYGQIKEYLESGQTLTAYGALMKFGCFRLAARIYELRQGGLDIKTKMITLCGKTYAEYSLKTERTKDENN